MKRRNSSVNNSAIFWLIFGAIVILAGIAAFLGLWAANTAEIYIGTSIALIVSILMVLLFIMATGFKYLGLSDGSQALGLPEGSIRAMISLFLIMIFVALSLYLYRTVYIPPTNKLENLTEQEVNSYGERVLARDFHEETQRYDVWVSASNPDGVDIAKQLINTIGTLVVAVAGFYFGSRTVQVARGIASPEESIILSMEPKQATQGEPISLTILGEKLLQAKTVKLVHITNKKELIAGDVLSNDIKIIAALKVDDTADVGKYDLIVINQDGTEVTLKEAFMINQKSVVVTANVNTPGG